ncbi:MAG: hypothetical protein ACREVA_07625 [Burkholderiales bacterium]
MTYKQPTIRTRKLMFPTGKITPDRSEERMAAEQKIIDAAAAIDQRTPSILDVREALEPSLGTWSRESLEPGAGIRDPIPARDPFDDRRYCRECKNLSAAGRCMASRKVTGGWEYYPVDTIPRRCTFFSEVKK